MFKLLRRLIVPIMLVALLAFVALIVLQWGLEFTGRGRQGAMANYAAMINGEQVTWEAYNRIYQNLYQQEAAKSEEELPDATLKQIEDNAWQQILSDKLLLQQADKLGLTVTDEEVYQYLRYSPPTYLQQIPEFQTDGKFDYQKYLSAMLEPQAGPFWASVEQMARTELLKMKVQYLILQSVDVTEDEVKQDYLANTDSITVGAVDVPIDRFMKELPEPTETEIQNYYDAHQDMFRQGERATLNIASLEKAPSEADWERAKERIDVIYDSLKAGADFAEMAQRYSQDGSAKNGGDLGWFAEGRMVPEFDQRSFSMKAGELSEPFKTQFGYHIILHHGYRTEEKVPPGKTKKEKVKEAHVSHILIKAEMSPETRDSLYTLMQDFVVAAKKDGFKQAAEELNIPTQETRPFTEKGQPPVSGNREELLDFAFSQKVGAMTDVLNNASSFIVAQIAQLLPAGVPPLDEVKTQVNQNLVKQMLIEETKKVADEVYSETQSGTSLEKAAKKHDVRYYQPPPFVRTGFIQGIGRYPEIVGAAFSLTDPAQISKPVEYVNGTAIFQLISKQSPDLTTFNEKRDSVYNAVLLQKQRRLYNGWYQNLVKNADIENNIAQMDLNEEEQQ